MAINDAHGGLVSVTGSVWPAECKKRASLPVGHIPVSRAGNAATLIRPLPNLWPAAQRVGCAGAAMPARASGGAFVADAVLASGPRDGA
jgi:hypothetical protein